MLRMKKNFVGLALIATLFVGCQSAQKKSDAEFNAIYGENVDLDAMFPGYGSDRRPASGIEPVIGEVFKSLRGVKIAAAKGTTSKLASEEFLNMINRLKTEEVKAIRDAKVARLKQEGKTIRKGIDDRLDAEDVKGLSPKTQAELSANFLKSKGLQDLQTLNSVRGKVEAQMAKVAETDTDAASRKYAQKLLTENRDVGGVNKNAATYGELSKAFANLEQSLKNGASEAEVAEIKREIKRVRIEAAEIWDLSGDSHLIAETCENLDRASLRKYGDFLESIRKELSQYSKRDPQTKRWSRVQCRNIDKITAWIAAKFQVVLGRVGRTAYTAVEEMTFCKYVKDNVGSASRTLASEFGNEVPKNVNCQY